MLPYIIHVGAHKTATTYLQNRLQQNQDLLVPRNVFYPHIFETRRNLTYRQDQDPDAPNDFILNLRNKRAEGHRVILSDENLAGGVEDIFNFQHQYREIGNKISNYAKILGSKDIELYFCIREYSSYIASMYCEFLRHNTFLPFESYYDPFRKSGFSWVKVVSDIHDALPDAKIVIWDFGRFRELEEHIFTEMVGFDAQILKPLKETSRDSFSILTIECIAKLSEVLAQEEMKAVIPRIAKTFPKSEEYPKYDPVPLVERALYAEQYQNDMDKIAMIEGNITMLR